MQHKAPKVNAIDAPKISLASRCQEPIISQGKPITTKEKTPIVENKVKKKFIIHLLSVINEWGVQNRSRGK